MFRDRTAVCAARLRAIKDNNTRHKDASIRQIHEPGYIQGLGAIKGVTILHLVGQHCIPKVVKSICVYRSGRKIIEL